MTQKILNAVSESAAFLAHAHDLDILGPNSANANPRETFWITLEKSKQVFWLAAAKLCTALEVYKRQVQNWFKLVAAVARLDRY